MNKLCVLSLACGLTFGCSATDSPQSSDSPRSQGAPAIRADSVVDSVGVNIHLGYDDTAYADFEENVVPALRYLGVRHVRDGIDDDECFSDRGSALADAGIGMTALVPYSVESMPTLIDCIREQVTGLDAVEGPNETDVFTQFEYGGEQFPDGTVAFMQDFHASMKSDDELRQIPIYQTTLAFPQKEPESPATEATQADRLGDLSEYADFGNSHNYFSGGDPPGAVIADEHLPFVRQITPDKPYVSTEGGYAMGDSDGNKGEWGDDQSAPFDEDVHARYVSRYLLEMLRNGYSMSFLYELLDIDESEWGLFRDDGSPKPAADGVRAMLGLLSEGSWNEDSRTWEVPEFTPASLSYELSAVPASVHSLLTQKSNGTFYLILWNEVTSWDPVRGAPLDTSPLEATLTVELDVEHIRTYVPTDSGTDVASESTTRTIDLDVLDRPVIVEIVPDSS